MIGTYPRIPRYLYVAACYSERDASAYLLLVTSDEEHDPDDEAGSAAIVRLLAQASERRDWFTTDDAYREEMRRTAGRIGAVSKCVRVPPGERAVRSLGARRASAW